MYITHLPFLKDSAHIKHFGGRVYAELASTFSSRTTLRPSSTLTTGHQEGRIGEPKDSGIRGRTQPVCLLSDLHSTSTQPYYFSMLSIILFTYSLMTLTDIQTVDSTHS
jgi:hypothetical protein